MYLGIQEKEGGQTTVAGNGERFADETVISTFIPTLAKTWQRTITVSKADDENRLKQLVRTYEVLLKTLSALLYGRVRHYGCDLPKTIQFLKEKPTLGRFLRFNSNCRKILRSQNDPWMQDVDQAFHTPLAQQAVINVCRTTMVDLKEDKQWNKQAVTVRELFGILLELRNRTEHDAPPKTIVKALHENLYLTFLDIFSALQPVLAESWYAVQTSQTLPDRKHQYEMREFCGMHENLKEVVIDRHLIEKRLYVYDQRLPFPWIDLWPVAHWDDTDNRIYLYNGFLTDKNAVFIDYSTTGRPLHVQGQTFAELFNLPAEADEAFDDEQISEWETDKHLATLVIKGKSETDDQDESLTCVSYVREDDQPPPGETEGWVTGFTNRLIALLRQKLNRKEAYSLCIESPQQDETVHVTPDMLTTLQQIPFWLVIVSRSYAASDWCRRENDSFVHLIGERAQNDSGVFVIRLDQIHEDQLPPEFEEIQHSYDFFVTGSDRKHSVLTPTRQQDLYRYNNLLARLNRDLADALQKRQRRQKQAVTLTQQSMSSPSNGESVVFLAGVTDDLEPAREEIKESLTASHIRVIPEFCYFTEPETFKNTIRDDLARSDLFVQLLGVFPGKRPPGLPQGYVRQQYELALSSGKPILQWRSPELDIDGIQDADWHDFLRLATVRAVPLENFVSKIIRTLIPPSPSEEKKAIGGTNPPLIFVDADTDDSLLAYDICQRLMNFGAECVLPVQSHKPSETREAFEQCVIQCDAMMIVYGSVTPRWVNDQFLAVRRLEWRRERPFDAYAIYDGPPEQKSPVNVMSPRINILQCRSRLDDQQLGTFIETVQAR